MRFLKNVLAGLIIAAMLSISMLIVGVVGGSFGGVGLGLLCIHPWLLESIYSTSEYYEGQGHKWMRKLAGEPKGSKQFSWYDRLYASKITSAALAGSMILFWAVMWWLKDSDVFLTLSISLALTWTIGVLLIEHRFRHNYTRQARPVFIRHSLTIRNKLDKSIIVMTSRKVDHDHPELIALTVLQKDETKLVEDAVLAGQRFYIIMAKETTASESDGVLFISEFTEDELVKLNWTVVIEPGYEPPLPQYYQQAADPFNRENQDSTITKYPF